MQFSVSTEILIQTIGLVGGLVGVYLRLDRRLTRVETQTELYWSGIQKELGKVIRQPIHYRKDDLIDRFPKLTDAELKELHEIIRDEYIPLRDTKSEKSVIWLQYLQGIEREERNREHHKQTLWGRLKARICQ